MSTAKLIHLKLFGDDLTTTLRDICFDFVDLLLCLETERVSLFRWRECGKIPNPLAAW